jgi:hypothetical protein
MFKILSRLALVCGFVGLSAVSIGQTVSGSFAPATVAANANSTLTLNYAGFTPQSLGAVFRLYYRAADFSSGPTFTSTVTDFQGQGSPTAGTSAGCTNADTYVTLNWVNFGAAWPAAAAGQLGTVAVTTAAGFNANAVVCSSCKGRGRLILHTELCSNADHGCIHNFDASCGDRRRWHCKRDRDVYGSICI